MDAYDLYLRAKEQHIRNRQFSDAADLLDQVIEQDPNFVEALVWRAFAELMRSDFFIGTGEVPVGVTRSRADEWIQAAEAIDPGSPDVLAVRGLYHHMGIEISPDGDAVPLPRPGPLPPPGQLGRKLLRRRAPLTRQLKRGHSAFPL